MANSEPTATHGKKVKFDRKVRFGSRTAQALSRAALDASASSWSFDATTPADPAVKPPQNAGGSMSEWVALGKSIGFLPALDDLAVLVCDKATAIEPDTLVNQVRRVAKRLEAENHEHAAIAVAATDLPDDLETRIFDEGAQLLIVDSAFLGSTEDRQLAWLQEALADPASESRAGSAPIPVQDDDIGSYDYPNPNLSPGAIKEWKRWVEQSDDID